MYENQHQAMGAAMSSELAFRNRAADARAMAMSNEPCTLAPRGQSLRTKAQIARELLGEAVRAVGQLNSCLGLPVGADQKDSGQSCGVIDDVDVLIAGLGVLLSGLGTACHAVGTQD